MTSESVEMPVATIHAEGPRQQINMKKSKPGSGRSELGMALLFIAPAHDRLPDLLPCTRRSAACTSA